jgi:hypothetical protein
MIPEYPEFAEITLEMKGYLDPILREYNEGLSEYTFAGLFLFRKQHHYRISKIGTDTIILVGNDNGKPFFMLPATLPEMDIVDELVTSFSGMKGVSETKQAIFSAKGYMVTEDRDNFDYLYFRNDLAKLPGKKFHKKRNLVTGFLNSYSYEGKPLVQEHIDSAFAVLERWRASQTEAGDYAETREALTFFEELELCGAIYDVEGIPSAFVIGEPLVPNMSYVTHFEKADTSYRGIYQFINKAFASVLPKTYIYLNREQDLGDEGLRQAKLTYRPCSFVKKYRVVR